MPLNGSGRVVSIRLVWAIRPPRRHPRGLPTGSFKGLGRARIEQAPLSRDGSIRRVGSFFVKSPRYPSEVNDAAVHRSSFYSTCAGLPLLTAFQDAHGDPPYVPSTAFKRKDQEGGTVVPTIATTSDRRLGVDPLARQEGGLSYELTEPVALAAPSTEVVSPIRPPSENVGAPISHGYAATLKNARAEYYARHQSPPSQFRRMIVVRWACMCHRKIPF